MDNNAILRIAMEQSARDIRCAPSDFLCQRNVIVPFSLGTGCAEILSGAHRLHPGFVWKQYRGVGPGRVQRPGGSVYGPVCLFHCFETPHMHWLNERLESMGQRICFMAEYYLPDMERLRALPCGYELRVLEQADFAGLYRPEWSNALCSDRKHLGCHRRGRL